MKNFAKIVVLVPFVVLLVLLFRHFKASNKTIFLPNNNRLTAELAKSPEAIAKGLSGRLSLKPNQAMLFVYEVEQEYCFWMKDMNFSVDIIWLNNAKEVVDVEQDVSADTYPQTFCPDQPAKYVLETNSGVAASTGLKKGAQVTF